MTELTQKQEGFCLSYIECGNASEAYRLNYNVAKMKPTTVNRKATELMGNGTITARLEDLKAGHAKRHDITVNTITQDLIDDRQVARGNQQSNVAISATLGLAKLHGHMTDKVEHSGSLDLTVSPEWFQLQGKILLALLPYPEAKRAVIEALAEVPNGQNP